MDDNKENNSPLFRPLKGRNYGPLLGYLIATLVLITLMNYFLMPKQSISSVDFSTFKEKIQKGEIRRVEMTPSYYMGFTITQEEAQKLCLTGWVRNRRDGSVEAVVQGDFARVEEMIRWFYKGSPYSAVIRVTVNEETPVEETTVFEIRYI